MVKQAVKYGAVPVSVIRCDNSHEKSGQTACSARLHEIVSIDIV
jgi:hypothetical protein